MNRRKKTNIWLIVMQSGRMKFAYNIKISPKIYRSF